MLCQIAQGLLTNLSEEHLLRFFDKTVENLTLEDLLLIIRGIVQVGTSNELDRWLGIIGQRGTTFMFNAYKIDSKPRAIPKRRELLQLITMGEEQEERSFDMSRMSRQLDEISPVAEARPVEMLAVEMLEDDSYDEESLEEDRLAEEMRNMRVSEDSRPFRLGKRTGFQDDKYRKKFRE